MNFANIKHQDNRWLVKVSKCFIVSLWGHVFKIWQRYNYRQWHTFGLEEAINKVLQ